MEAIAHIVEVSATFVENMVILCTVVVACGKRFSGAKHIALVTLFTTVISIYVTGMNCLSLFSFLTPLGTIVFITGVSSKFVSQGKLLRRGTVCIMALFVIQMIDYLMIMGIGLAYGDPSTTFFRLITPGVLRISFVLVNKVLDTLLYFALKKYLPQFSSLRTKALLFLFVAATFSYAIMQYLFSVVIYGDYLSLQGASIISFFYLLCFVSSVIVALFAITEAEKERGTNEILHSSNQMLQQNYQQIHKNALENAKRLHDFHHHLVAIQGMAEKGQPERIAEYTNLLLENSYRALKLCRSGSDIVDAIINYKQSMAAEVGVKFNYKTELESLDAFSPVDICAILSNQIENAFEACAKMDAAENRFVSVDIRQQQNFVIFKVCNSVLEDPFAHNSGLATTKPYDSYQHGLGIRNIRDTAEKYNGSLRNAYADGVFTSTVMLCSTI